MTMSRKLLIANKKLAAAAFCFFLLKGLLWLAAGATLAVAAR